LEWNALRQDFREKRCKGRALSSPQWLPSIKMIALLRYFLEDYS